MTTFFKELFDYSHHFNQLVIAKAIEHDSRLSPKAIQLLNHTINAHQIWNSRLLKEPAGIGVWDVRPTGELAGIDTENYRTTLRILETVELSGIIEYKTSTGVAFKNSMRDILFHVVNHSTYHRAQIMTEFKNCGIEPIGTDFIFYKRD